jgi:hypothetical protein
MSVLSTLELVCKGFGIETLSPVQSAICKAMDGEPLGQLWDDANVKEVFGHAKPPEVIAETVLLVAASRALKTKITAARGVRSVMACDTGMMTPGDEARFSVLASDLDKAKVTLGNMLALAQRCYPDFIEGDPKVQSFRLMRDRDKGLALEVALAALAKGGGGLISRWSAGASFSEAPRMVGEEDGARNIDDSLTALRNRMLPGSSIVLEGSPWAPFGPIFDLDRERFGRPDKDVLVIRAPGPLLWPERYTKEYCERLRRIDERAFQADVLGKYVDPEDSLFATEDILACTEKGVMEREPRKDEAGELTIEYVAAMDPATRGNAWSLVIIGTTHDGPKGEEYEQAVAIQWQGTPQSPLDPFEVLKEAKAVCAPFGIDDAFTDQASFDALAAIGDRVGFGLIGLFGAEDSRDLDCEAAYAAISQRRIELLDNGQQRTDLQRVAKRVTSNNFVYQYPTSGNGRHCDFVPALGRAIRYAPRPPGDTRPERTIAKNRPKSAASWAKGLVR